MIDPKMLAKSREDYQFSPSSRLVKMKKKSKLQNVRALPPSVRVLNHAKIIATILALSILPKAWTPPPKNLFSSLLRVKDRVLARDSTLT